MLYLGDSDLFQLGIGRVQDQNSGIAIPVVFFAKSERLLIFFQPGIGQQKHFLLRPPLDFSPSSKLHTSSSTFEQHLIDQWHSQSVKKTQQQ